ncbi:MAG: 4Fe-4S dicluster domain-containing protein [Candidatus Kariarchaeaceae archaeon]
MTDAYIVGKKKNRVLALDRDRCKGCSICVTICPYTALDMSTKKTHMGYIHPIEINGACIACRECVYACPDFALSIHKLDDVLITNDEAEESKEVPK